MHMGHTFVHLDPDDIMHIKHKLPCMHCPVLKDADFSFLFFPGTAVAAAPSKSMLDLSEDCDAKSTLVQTQGCVGAYDKMPLASASCLFTMDTSSDIFIMHSFQV